MRICRVANSTFFLCHHLNEQIRATLAAGHEVHLVASEESDLGGGREELFALPAVRFHGIDIRREISLGADLKALLGLIRLFRRERFDVVHTVTAKGGLLGSIAAYISGVPVRLHTYAGQPWIGRSGLVRWLAKAGDWLVARLSTVCYTDSGAQRLFLEREGIAPTGAIRVLGAGSIAGVDLSRFSPARFDREEIRKELGVSTGAKVISFVGRLSIEKGVRELIEAFCRLESKTSAEVYLLLVGPAETGVQALPAEMLAVAERNPRIKRVGYTDVPERFLAASDVFCLPSYREGFGSVVIEAGAMEVPAVVSRIFGLSDSVVDGQTGIFVEPRAVEELADALARIIEDDALRRRLGQGARLRVEQLFDAEYVNGLVVQEYSRWVMHPDKSSSGGFG